jgi:hypothetical protein
MIGDLALVVIIAALAGAAGIALGIVVLAPRLTRLLDRSDEEPGERDD